MDAAAQSTELTVLIWSVLLLLGHIVVQTLSLIRDCGAAYAVGERDGSRIPGPVTARLTSLHRQLAETEGAPFIAAPGGPG